MAPKTRESSRKRKEKAPTFEPWDFTRFFFKAHQHHFYDVMRKKKWRKDAQGWSYQLGRLDLRPVAKGWLEFIQCSIIPTSNRSEVTVERVVMIHCIMLINEVEVHEEIPQEFYRVTDKPSTSARLAFPHLIHRLCSAARAHIEGDTLIEKERPITKKGMEHARESVQGPQQEPVPPSLQDISEMPQGMYFPPYDYWDQLTTSLGELTSSVDQLRLEHQDQSALLHQMMEDQRRLMEEQRRQGSDIEELKRSGRFPGGSSNCHH
ncbi:hypothetical protein AHAS_Ahas17G0228300 [Arachis hypogaea]